MTDLLGNKHWLGAKPQAVAGTKETTVTTFLATTKIKMDGNMKPIERAATLTTGYELPPLAGWLHPSAACSCEYHASQPQPFYWALGAVNTTTPVGTVRLHSITEADAPVRLTLEADKIYQKDKQGDCFVSKLGLNFKPGEIATLDLEFLGLSHLGDQTLTSTPAFTTDPLVCSRAAVKFDGVADYTVEGGSFTWDGALEEALGLTDQTDREALKIRRKGNPEITAKLDFLDFPKANLAAMLAGTTFALVIELTGAVIESTYRKMLRVTLPACRYTGGLDTEVADGLITGSADIKAYYDTVSSKRILVEAQNTISAINT
jgi:hypothetical protein